MIHTTRLLLRPPAATDLPWLYEIYSDPATNVYNPAGPYTSMEKVEFLLQTWLQHWKHHGFGMWAIEEKDHPGVVIGFGGLTWKMYGDTERLNIGYRFAPGAWGKGYATELCHSGLAYAFHELQQPVVYGLVRPQNKASVRVLEKSGMLRYSTLNDVPGQEESFVYRLLAQDFGG
ncbi:GNAT family N-acetyltransferase [Chitinophaga vietnamensis]|uniref:GNAT family N-acetyltransferase n=1 Tax=Chitinophaga vietnamensis TaxID=2593957 RepID=UPI0011779344|nr:GNAT family N-acetyltransferase [Chitinophaga vietnamensis]